MSDAKFRGTPNHHHHTFPPHNTSPSHLTHPIISPSIMPASNLVLALGLSLLAAAVGQVAALASCTSNPAYKFETCAIKTSRDLLFVVDASGSLDPLKFNGVMLDYAEYLYCAFNG